MKLNELRPAKGAVKSRKRVGRGRSSGHGKTATRGEKGQKSRSGVGLRPAFEGGQMPLTRRVPKLPGFKSLKREEYKLIDLDKLNALGVKVVNPTVMLEKGLIRKADQKVKILADGEVAKALMVQAHAFSKKAKEKIEAAGGKAEVVS